MGPKVDPSKDSRLGLDLSLHPYNSYVSIGTDYILLRKISLRILFRFTEDSFPKTSLRINSSPTPPPCDLGDSRYTSYFNIIEI